MVVMYSTLHTTVGFAAKVVAFRRSKDLHMYIISQLQVSRRNMFHGIPGARMSLSPRLTASAKICKV